MSDAPFPGTPLYRIGSAASGRDAASAASAGSIARSGRGEAPDRGRGEAAQIADNIIRQRLRVGDPNDPAEVARGLRRLFPEEAQMLDAEAAGLPLPTAISVRVSNRVESMATSAEMERADAAVGRDLRALVADHRLGDVTEELFGWEQSIQATLAEGRSAAALALDPRARDRLFGARRQLNDYSRLARMVGALSPANGSSYRQLASSLDEAASLLLVLAGETLAGQSLGGLRFLPSVSGSEIQSRRDAVLAGLRAIFGCSGTAVDCDGFPWSMDGLRKFLKRIEESGHLDLRVLLDESTLGRHLDSLVDLVARNDGPGLRALGATADVATHRLHRLLAIGDEVPPAPALSHFLKALQLFLDTFTSSQAGYRLLYVGRPAIAQRGRLGFGSMDPATTRLMTLVGQRARLAGFADCMLACDCEPDDVLRQIRLDKVLYDVDRAIDLYTLGSDPRADGEAEWRAAAYGALIHANLGYGEIDENVQSTSGALVSGGLRALLLEISQTLLQGKLNLMGSEAYGTQDRIDAMLDELCMQSLSDARLDSVVQTMGVGCAPTDKVFDALKLMVTRAMDIISSVQGRVRQQQVRAEDCQLPKVDMPPPIARSSASTARSLWVIRQRAFPTAYDGADAYLTGSDPGQTSDQPWDGGRRDSLAGLRRTRGDAEGASPQNFAGEEGGVPGRGRPPSDRKPDSPVRGAEAQPGPLASDPGTAAGGGTGVDTAAAASGHPSPKDTGSSPSTAEAAEGAQEGARKRAAEPEQDGKRKSAGKS